MLTANMLRTMSACSDQVAVFESVWPNGVELPTVKIVQRAMELDLDMEWVCKKIALTPMWAEYKAKRVSLLAEYDEKIDQLKTQGTKRALLWVGLFATRPTLN